jgi:hypothetical protein
LPPPPVPSQLVGPRNDIAAAAVCVDVLHPCKVICTTVPTAALPGQTVMNPAGWPSAASAGWFWVTQPLVVPGGDAVADGDTEGDGSTDACDLRGLAERAGVGDGLGVGLGVVPVIAGEVCECRGDVVGVRACPVSSSGTRTDAAITAATAAAAPSGASIRRRENRRDRCPSPGMLSGVMVLAAA